MHKKRPSAQNVQAKTFTNTQMQKSQKQPLFSQLMLFDAITESYPSVYRMSPGAFNSTRLE